MVLVLSVAYILVLGPIVPGFASRENLGNVASNMLPLLVVAIGQTFVLIAGGIDLSATAVIALASVVGASITSADGGLLAGNSLAVPVAVAAMIGIGLLAGLVNGASVALLRMPPFMVTLASMMVLGGLAVWYTRSQKIYDLPDAFLAIGQGSLLGVVPYALIVTGTLVIAAHIALQHTLFGRWLYAVGMNGRTAEISGVPVALVVTAAFLVSGACAAVGSILYTARLETGSPEMGQRILLDVIAAAVIGGTSLYGGRGKVAWTVSGVLFITLIDNSLNLMNLSNFAILIVKGVVILLAALLDAMRTRFASRD
jgi:ribose/xylose/arabinose/galactoside ABC-type transport system permease subunit